MMKILLIIYCELIWNNKSEQAKKRTTHIKKIILIIVLKI